MDQNLLKMKQDLSQELSWLLSKLPELKKAGKKEDLDYNYEQVIAKTSQLYYLNLYHINKISNLTPDYKKEIKKKILAEYHEKLIKLEIIYRQIPVK